MNTKYGRLANGRIEYAPNALETDDGVKINPSRASYLAAGWKEVVDVKPTAEPGCRVEVSGWREDAETLTCVYKVVPGETPPAGPRVFSKLKLVAALKAADKWVLVKTWIEGIPRRAKRGELRSNFARGVRGLWDYYLAAQNFREDNEMFADTLAAIKAYARMTDEDTEAILSKCIWED